VWIFFGVVDEDVLVEVDKRLTPCSRIEIGTFITSSTSLFVFLEMEVLGIVDMF
jgi:hypothetical protein